MSYYYQYLPFGSVKFDGYIKYSVDFVKQKQLLKKELWEKFTEVFQTLEDSVDNGWRGEFWGKMMRGACLTYMYDNDKELYEAIDFGVMQLLKRQDNLGRFSTYDLASEFHGWDVWSRKYVLTGLQHFYRICIDQTKKEQVLRAMKKHVDYMMSLIGDDKISILETSTVWGGINSASILEPICELYRQTNESKYLEFAKHILNSGGCKDGNLLDLAEQGKVMPFEYPEIKAYETISYFEGVLAYYEVTGDIRYYDIVNKFVQALLKTDTTIVGSCGCSHELFDNASIKQSEFTNKPMQETCVTVTLMRLIARLYMLNGDQKYADVIENCALNALYGAINENDLKQFSKHDRRYVEGLPFDSYSPLASAKRGVEIGGVKRFASGGYYGCCGCIAAAGIAIYPLTSVLKGKDFYTINNYASGQIRLEEITLNVTGNYITQGNVEINIETVQEKRLKLFLRIPCWAKKVEAKYNGENLLCENGFVVLDKTVNAGDQIMLRFGVELEEILVNGRTAFRYGAIVLSQEIKEEYSFGQAIKLKRQNGMVKYSIINGTDGFLRIQIYLEDQTKINLINYAQSGKDWLKEESIVNVWFNVVN